MVKRNFVATKTNRDKVLKIISDTFGTSTKTAILFSAPHACTVFRILGDIVFLPLGATGNGTWAIVKLSEGASSPTLTTMSAGVADLVSKLEDDVLDFGTIAFDINSKEVILRRVDTKAKRMMKKDDTIILIWKAGVNSMGQIQATLKVFDQF